ncbi:DUF1798 family protein [Lentibacillus sediminis]|uniref:DUF1798 family protein n=1 Tax=Lentibacillus sediminis TaxID=1940529 RepID=UPI000C1C01F1|nr:DUF1798 family protein [Lentibacillus sediminis]
MDLTEQTKQLKQHIDWLKDRYETTPAPENRKDKQLFMRVKEETTPIYDLLENWETEALKAVKARNVNVHPQQIASTKENAELFMMHSYYIDVRRKRYMELHRSIHYIFDQLLREL